jgi:hypothetical protein
MSSVISYDAYMPVHRVTRTVRAALTYTVLLLVQLAHEYQYCVKV